MKLKDIIVMIIGIIMILFGTITSVYATNYLYNADEIRYNSSSDVQTAIDNLYTLSSQYDTLNAKFGNATLNTPATNASDAINSFNTNNLLWSGSETMPASKTITLSDSVSNQQNGIILAFALPSTSDRWNFCVIPKYFVANHSGAGVSCNMSGANFSNMATKYLYITNTTIIGNNDNTTGSRTTNGIVHNNSVYALRYVVGF